MSGTKEGGYQARDTNREKYGADFYRILGAKGGRASRTGGFQKGSDLAREAGRKGGAKSRRNRKLELERAAAARRKEEASMQVRKLSERFGKVRRWL